MMMNRFAGMLAWAAATLILVGCAPSESYQKAEDLTPDHTARLYVYRDQLGVNGGILMKTEVYVDNARAALIDNREYASVFLQPGTHQVSIRSDENFRKDSVEFAVSGGDVKYFEVVNNPKRLATAIAVPWADMVTSKAHLLAERTKDDFRRIEKTLREVPRPE